MNNRIHAHFFSLSLMKTGDPEIDQEIKRFSKETIGYLKWLRSTYKSILQSDRNKASMMNGTEPEEVSRRDVDKAIEYQYRKKKSEDEFICSINVDDLDFRISTLGHPFLQSRADIEACGIDPSKPFIVAPNEESVDEAAKMVAASGINPDNITIVSANDKFRELYVKRNRESFLKVLPEFETEDEEEEKALKERYELLDADGELDIEKWCDLVDTVAKRYEAYAYLKRLNVFQDVKEMLDADRDLQMYANALSGAFAWFQKKYGVVKGKLCFFQSDGVARLIQFTPWRFQNAEEDVPDEEMVEDIDESYLEAEPDKLWCPNIREICISPYQYNDPESGVQINLSSMEIAVSFPDKRMPAWEILKNVQKIRKIFQANLDLAESQGKDSLPAECLPHYQGEEGELVMTRHISILSEEMELVTISLYDERMILKEC